MSEPLLNYISRNIEKNLSSFTNYGWEKMVINYFNEKKDNKLYKEMKCNISNIDEWHKLAKKGKVGIEDLTRLNEVYKTSEYDKNFRKIFISDLNTLGITKLEHYEKLFDDCQRQIDTANDQDSQRYGSLYRELSDLVLCQND